MKHLSQIHEAKRPIISQKARGQGMVEFAMALPVLLMLVVGIMEFGRLLWTYSAVISSAREAARYGAAGGSDSISTVPYYQHCDGIRQAALRIGSMAGVRSETIQIQYDRGPADPDPITNRCLAAGDFGPMLEAGDRVIVTVQSEFVPALGLMKLPAIHVSSTVRRTIVVNVELD